MRHRYVVNLYSDDHFDAEISDYLTMFGGTKKQELLRTLLRVGYSSLVKHKNNPASIAAGFSSDELIAVIALLSANGIIPQSSPGQQHVVDGFPGGSSTHSVLGQNSIHKNESSDHRDGAVVIARPQQKPSKGYEITHSEVATKQYTENDIVIMDDAEDFVDPLQSFADIPSE